MAPFERISVEGRYTWRGLLSHPPLFGTSMLAASAAYPQRPTDLLVANPGKISPDGPLAIYRRRQTGGWRECPPNLLATKPRDMFKFTDFQYAPSDPLQVYAVTAEVSEFTDLPLGEGVGLFYSIDGGESFRRLDIDLPRLRGEPLSVDHLALAPDGSVL